MGLSTGERVALLIYLRDLHACVLAGLSQCLLASDLRDALRACVVFVSDYAMPSKEARQAKGPKPHGASAPLLCG